MAVEAHASTRRRFPPPYVTDAEGKPLYSWRVLILPWIDGGLETYERWHFDEPWDSPHNLSLPTPTVYQCPARNRPPYTDYMAVVGPGLSWEENRELKFEDIRDGASNTVMIVEVRNSYVHWAEPVDIDGSAPLKINDATELSIGTFHSDSLRVYFPGGSSLAELPGTTTEEELRSLLTRDGAETIDWDGDGVIYHQALGGLVWSDHAWRTELHLMCVGSAPFAIDFDIADPTTRAKLHALEVAGKLDVHLNGEDHRRWIEKVKLDLAQKVLDAASEKADSPPPDEELQQVADTLTLDAWGMTYVTEDKVVFPYFVFTAPQIPGKKIRIQFTTELEIDKVTIADE